MSLARSGRQRNPGSTGGPTTREHSLSEMINRLQVANHYAEDEDWLTVRFDDSSTSSSMTTPRTSRTPSPFEPNSATQSSATNARASPSVYYSNNLEARHWTYVPRPSRPTNYRRADNFMSVSEPINGMRRNVSSAINAPSYLYPFYGMYKPRLINGTIIRMSNASPKNSEPSWPSSSPSLPPSLPTSLPPSLPPSLSPSPSDDNIIWDDEVEFSEGNDNTNVQQSTTSSPGQSQPHENCSEVRPETCGRCMSWYLRNVFYEREYKKARQHIIYLQHKILSTVYCEQCKLCKALCECMIYKLPKQDDEPQ